MTTCVECGENVVVEKAGTFHVRDPHDPAATADHEAVEHEHGEKCQGCPACYKATGVTMCDLDCPHTEVAS